MPDWTTRKLHFVGIGGAGMSGLALVCERLGASVGGSDRSESSYLPALREAGIAISIGHAPGNLPADAEVVVSTAIDEENPELALARHRGQVVHHRGEVLAELCSEKRLIAVSGTHGKTTTTAMIAWGMRAAGLDPAFFLGGELPGAGAGGASTNSGWGQGEWVVAEADESDGSFLRLDPEVAVITNVEMDHHSRWTSLARLREAFAEFAAGAGGVAVPLGAGLEGLAGGARLVEFDESTPGPSDLRLAVPGLHNRLNARAALAGIVLAGEDPAAAAEGLAGFPGVRRRLELRGEPGGARVYDDYAHHPTEVRAALSSLRELGPERLIAIFQPHLYSRTRAFAEEFGAALALADEVGVLDVYPAREKPVGELAGVSGLEVAEAAAERSGGRPVWWLRRAEVALAAFAPRLRDGVIVVTIGAGDITELAGQLAGGADPVMAPGTDEPSPPEGVERDFPLARLTTVRTGGPADFFARPAGQQELLGLLEWAESAAIPVGVIGSGSNLLVADDGYRGLAIKLDGALATIEREDSRVLVGGGARLPSVSAKAARWGLSGIEFGVNIPGSAGGAVKMNANAYGGELAGALEWVDVCSARGVERRVPEQLGFSYRHSNLVAGEVVSRVCLELRPADPEQIRGALEEMREWRREAQPSGIKTFGSTFKNPDELAAGGRTAGQLLEAAGCRGMRQGGARFAPKHANFVENTGDATTADVLALMAKGRRRVQERFDVSLEPEVQVLGEVSWPETWKHGSE